MNNYDKQYSAEKNLFGDPYPEFEAFLKAHAPGRGHALDLGCGQGRDALLLAQYGYAVTAVDSSKVGVEQMVARAEAQHLPVKGLVADFFEYQLPGEFEAIVLDSILHFGKAGKKKELALLDNCAAHIAPKGYLFIFIHKSAKKEKILQKWLADNDQSFTLVQEGNIDYIYEEESTGFKADSPFYMFFLQRTS